LSHRLRRLTQLLSLSATSHRAILRRDKEEDDLSKQSAETYVEKESPRLAGLIGLITSFRMMRPPDPRPSGSPKG